MHVIARPGVGGESADAEPDQAEALWSPGQSLERQTNAAFFAVIHCRPRRALRIEKLQAVQHPAVAQSPVAETRIRSFIACDRQYTVKIPRFVDPRTIGLARLHPECRRERRHTCCQPEA